MLTARTLYTYKYEVAINNDKLYGLASVFYPQNSCWSVIFCQAGRAPVRVAPVGFSLRDAHLSGQPADTLRTPGVGRPAGTEDTRLCGRRAGIWPGRARRVCFSDLNLRLLFSLLVS